MSTVLQSKPVPQDNLAEKLNFQQKLQTVTKEYMAKAQETLTDDQKSAWKEMTGEPFELKIDARAGGERGRRPGGEGGGDTPRRRPGSGGTPPGGGSRPPRGNDPPPA